MKDNKQNQKSKTEYALAKSRRRVDNSVILSVGEILRKRFQNKSKNLILFSKIRKVGDSNGNNLVPETGMFTSGYCKTNTILKPGNKIDFIVEAESLDGSDLEYSLDVDYKNVFKWQSESKFTLTITEKNISKFCQVRINVRHKRSYQPMNVIDDSVIFSYQVIPDKIIATNA
jgi:hypothetical protein